MMHWLIETQRWLYGAMWDGMKAETDVSVLPAFLGSAFVFGMVHALMPGHGKSVLVSYHLGRPSRKIEGVTTGTLLALTHVGLAVVLVLAGIAVISRSFAQGGRAPDFDESSAALIVLIGVYLVYRAICPLPHTHRRDGRTLAMATGFVPCPLTTFILTYALAQNRLAVGLAAVIAMLGGVIANSRQFRGRGRLRPSTLHGCHEGFRRDAAKAGLLAGVGRSCSGTLTRPSFALERGRPPLIY